MPTPKLSRAEATRRLQTFEACLREGYTPLGVKGGRGSAVEETARRLGVSSGSLMRSIERALGPDAVRDAPPSAHPPADLAAEREKIRERDELARLRAQLKEAHREAIDAEVVREQIFGLAARVPSPPDWLLENRTGGSAPGVPVTIWSDWHWGEVVRPEEVGGVNAFNSTIGRERARNLVERTIDLCFGHMVRPEYPGVVVCLGGDMITGTIHQELAETNDLPTLAAVMDVADAIAWGLGHMADRFGRVFVPCVVGNHGRNTLKPRAKGRVHTSLEWLLYCQLERHFCHDARVRFLISGDADCHFRVYGHRFMLTHGDALGVKGGDGIIGSLGPITRGRIKTRDSEAQVGRDFDTLLIGHWHTYLPLPGLVVNGALKGYDEFARLYLRAKYQRAIQALFFVHRKHGVTCHWPVFVDDSRASTAPADEWVGWRA